ncbi:MAG: hypothetical protein SFZ24_05840 [Planctomycetota bacterium]|nr:hypothetical protein [Planctomycetota bacterium]
MATKSACSLVAAALLCSCGMFAAAEAPNNNTPAPPQNGGAPNAPGFVASNPVYPFLWCVAGNKQANVTFSGLPIDRNRAVMFYEQHFGEYPRIWANRDGTHVSPEHGSIPQRTNYTTHLAKVRRDIAAGIPDPNWDGYAILDFEGWEPVWDLLRNERMKEESRRHVRARFPVMSPAEVERRAKLEFETAAFDFLQRTLEECKRTRPRAKWGFYGYPYAHQTQYQSRYQQLFDTVDAFYPPVYSVHYSVPDNARVGRSQRTATQYAREIDSKIAFARSVAGSRPIVPLIWMRYHDINIDYGGQWLNDLDLYTILKQPRISGAAASLFWEYIPDDRLALDYSAFFSSRGGQIMKRVVAEMNPAPVGGAQSQPRAASLSTSPATATPKGRITTTASPARSAPK